MDHWLDRRHLMLLISCHSCRSHFDAMNVAKNENGEIHFEQNIILIPSYDQDAFIIFFPAKIIFLVIIRALEQSRLA